LPTAPAADQIRLLEVQDADLRAQQARHKRDSLPVVAQIYELMLRAADLDEDRVARATEVSDLRRAVTKAEDDVETVRQRQERDNARMASGTGTAKDLQALQSELEVLTRRVSALEDVELEAMEALDGAQELLDAATTQTAAITAQIEELAAQRDAAYAELDAELATIVTERAAAADGLDPALIALYERVRDQHGGIGAAVLKGGQCQVCQLALNAAELAAIKSAPADAVVRCEECGRILVREDTA
jgi:predicted  nucleic acid-binding Zn-ribbon protein